MDDSPLVRKTHGAAGEEPLLKPKYGGPGFRELLRGVHAAVVVTSAIGTVLDANKLAAKMFGLNLARLRDEPVSKLIKGFRQSVLTRILTALAHEDHVVLQDAFGLRSDGTEFAIRIVVHDVSTSDWSGLCFSVHDIDAELVAAKELAGAATSVSPDDKLAIKAEMLEAQITAVTHLAHKLSNPIQTLLSMAEHTENEAYSESLKTVAELIQELREKVDMDRGSVSSTDLGERTLSGELTAPKNNRLLIVDDEKPLREAFRVLLEDAFEGFEIDVAANGRTAVEIFSKGHHGIVVLDLLMPGMNGEETFDKLADHCKASRWEMPSVLFCTGFGLPDSLRKLVREDPSHHLLSKPVKRADLVDAITHCLKVYGYSHDD